jgi:acetyl esterase/lipase
MAEAAAVTEVPHRPEFLALVDPELRDAALIMRRTTAAFTPMTAEKLAQRRAWADQAALAPHDHVSVEVVQVPRTAAGDEGEVAVYVVNRKPGASGAGILHIHGGGFTASRAAHGLRNVQALAAELDVPIVSVDYRLAPETRWSGSLEDNLAAFLWTAENAAELGIDPRRIALLGESAGGGHAALLALAARDRGTVQPSFQALIYPMIDDRSGTSRTLPEHVGYFGWNEAANLFGWESFLGMPPGGPEVSAAAVPARRDDLAGLPPTYIAVGSLDLFVEEDIDFAWRLLAAGVPTELLVVPGGFHGFDVFAPETGIARRFAAAKVAALRRGLGLD